MVDVEERVKSIINQQIKESMGDYEVSIDERFEEIGISSMTFIKFIVALESEFEIEFGEDELNIKKFQTIKDLLPCINEKIREKNVS